MRDDDTWYDSLGTVVYAPVFHAYTSNVDSKGGKESIGLAFGTCLMAEEGLPGYCVTQVWAGTPAEKAGVVVGDVVVCMQEVGFKMDQYGTPQQVSTNGEYVLESTYAGLIALLDTMGRTSNVFDLIVTSSTALQAAVCSGFVGPDRAGSGSGNGGRGGSTSVFQSIQFIDPAIAELRRGSKRDWVTDIDWWPTCCYFPCESADDFNTVAEHVGSPRRFSCMGIWCARTFYLCGGSCLKDDYAMQVHSEYEAMYGLNQRSISIGARYCCSPERVWKSIVGEIAARPGYPVVNQPVRTAHAATPSSPLLQNHP